MKFVALVSGGKDSIYATVQAIRNGHELVCCAHLSPCESIEDDDEESYMYQTAGSEAVRIQVEGCIGVPLLTRDIRGRSNNTALVYDGEVDSAGCRDEVEDLFELLQEVRVRFPSIQGVSSGAILSTYQRMRIENVCDRLGLTSLSFLWRCAPQRGVLDEILDDDRGRMDAVLVRVACPPGLLPQQHLGKSLRSLRDSGLLERLRERYGMHPAGEGGEYETLVLDCPELFRKGRLVLDSTTVAESVDGVGVLKIIQCHAEAKTYDERLSLSQHHSTQQTIHATSLIAESKLGMSIKDAATTLPECYQKLAIRSFHMPNIHIQKGGLYHISALLSPIVFRSSSSSSATAINEAAASVQEFLMILRVLRTILCVHNCTPQDIVHVHLYLARMSHFATINQYYEDYFGTLLPPSRSCVSVGSSLPGNRTVMMDCLIQFASGDYMRSVGRLNSNQNHQLPANQNPHNERREFVRRALCNSRHALRKTLHVQSISYWAPVCIGPYSQANILRSSIVLLAGMIGLIPQSMTLIQSRDNNVCNWELQLYQSWRNAAAVLDGLDDGGSVIGGKLNDCLGGLIYFSLSALEESLLKNNTIISATSDSIPWQILWNSAECISQKAISTNGGIVMGNVDGITSSDNTELDPDLYDDDGVLYGGYEDEETWREMTKSQSKKTSNFINNPSSPTGNNDANRQLEIPLLMVCLAELPMDAMAEVELICASRRAVSCLNVQTGPVIRAVVPSESVTHSHIVNHSASWDTGYDSIVPMTGLANNDPETSIEILSVARSLGVGGCACVSTVLANWKLRDVSVSTNSAKTTQDLHLFQFDIQDILSRMIDSSINNINGRGGSDGNASFLFSFNDVLNVRLYYKAASLSYKPRKNDSTDYNASINNNPSLIHIDMMDDGSMLRSHLHSVLHSKCRETQNLSTNIPAYTVVPVLGMHLSCSVPTASGLTSDSSPFSTSIAGCENNKQEMNLTQPIPQDSAIPLLAMQVTLVNLIQMETDMWVRFGREHKTI